MRIPRVIPALLLENDEFVKTTRFRSPRYIGDPVNTIDLFNQFEVDEIAVLDIRATTAGVEPPYKLLEALAAQCWVPLAYGGGIRDLGIARRVLGIGVEKVILGTILAETPEVAGEIAAVFGRQAVVAAVDVLTDTEPVVLVRHGSTAVGRDQRTTRGASRPREQGRSCSRLSIAMAHGRFDLPLIRSVASAVDIPVIALGGAGKRADLPDPVNNAGAAAVAAGSLFVFQGRSGGVLVNFPSRVELEAMFGRRDL